MLHPFTFDTFLLNQKKSSSVTHLPIKKMKKEIVDLGFLVNTHFDIAGLCNARNSFGALP